MSVAARVRKYYPYIVAYSDFYKALQHNPITRDVLTHPEGPNIAVTVPSGKNIFIRSTKIFPLFVLTLSIIAYPSFLSGWEVSIGFNEVPSWASIVVDVVDVGSAIICIVLPPKQKHGGKFLSSTSKMFEVSVAVTSTSI